MKRLLSLPFPLCVAMWGWGRGFITSGFIDFGQILKGKGNTLYIVDIAHIFSKYVGYLGALFDDLTSA